MKKTPVTFELDSFPLPDGSNAVGVGIALGETLGSHRADTDYRFYFWVPDMGDRPEFLGQWQRYSQQLTPCDRESLPPDTLSAAKAFWDDADNHAVKSEWISQVYLHHRLPVEVQPRVLRPRPKVKVSQVNAVDTKFRPAKVGKFTFESR